MISHPWPQIGVASRLALLLALAVVTQPAYAATFGTSLALSNGWTNAPFATSNATAWSTGGIVTLAGAIRTDPANTSLVPFTLPPVLRPKKPVFVPVDMCDASKGRLEIRPSGVVTLRAAGDPGGANAKCFTSLDGVSYAVNANGFTTLTLENGWTHAPFSTHNAAVKAIGNIVRFQGSIASSGTNLSPFTLPVGLRPVSTVYVTVDLCNATRGRLRIQASGSVVIEPEGGVTANATCFTSLDGASFAMDESGYTAMQLKNGWAGAPFSTSLPAYRNVDGVIALKGAMATSANSSAVAILPAAVRPLSDVYVTVNLCNATNGRLRISPNGTTTVSAEGSVFSNAQCFVSLDGVSYRLGASKPLALLNGWTGEPFGTGVPAVSVYRDRVRLRGAIATAGTNFQPFTLPVGTRPTSSVFVPIDLCGATKGRLFIHPDGTVTVSAQGGTTSNAQCFTSLDGVEFAIKNSGYKALTLENGWTNAPFGAANAAVRQAADGLVHFRGAIANGTAAGAFTLPPQYRPATDVYVTVDQCNATRGRLHISAGGAVSVQVESGQPFANATCFTSLEGVSFARSATDFTALTLINGWNNAPFSTSNAALINDYGVVRFKGAISTSGSDPTPFIIPEKFRPSTDVYIPVDLCDATNGRLNIQPNGTVTVQTEGSFTTAACFTSLDGVSYAQ